MTSTLPASRRYMGEANMLAPIYTRILELQRGRALLSALAAGALANLAFAPIYFWPAALLATTFLVWLMDGASVTENPKSAAFWRGGAFAFGLFGVGFHWLGFAFLVTPSAHLAFIWLVPGLIAVLALIWGVAFRIMIRFWCDGPARVVMFATTVVAAEWTRGHLFGGFPWNLPGMIWEPGGAVSQFAALGGIWTLSALTVAAFAAPAALADLRPRASAPSRMAPALAAAMAFGAVWGWGAQRLQAAPSLDAADGPMIRIVDAGTPQSEKHKPEQRANVLRRYLELTGPDVGDAPDIVIWPEGAVPYALLQWPDALDPVSARLGARRLIVGTSRVDRISAGRERWYNSVAVISGESRTRGALSIYDKHRLVPFGEFVPFRDVAARIGLETLQAIATNGFHPGPPPSRQSVPGMPAFGPLICYEALFPGLSPRLEDRPDWLVNVSIDAWFGRLWGPAQHSDHARYRAIEEGLPLARAASGGVSAMIDPYGRVTGRAAPADAAVFGEDPEGWRARVLDVRLPGKLDATAFSRLDSAVFWIFMLIFNLGLFVLPRK